MNENKFNVDDDVNEKRLVNVYLSQKTSEQIDDIIFYIKKRLPFDKRRKLTKSNFYEIGLQVLIEEYNLKGEESSLWKAIENSFRK